MSGEILFVGWFAFARVLETLLADELLESVYGDAGVCKE